MSILKFVNRVFKAQGQNVSALIPFKFETRKNILTEKYCTCVCHPVWIIIYLFIYLYICYCRSVNGPILGPDSNRFMLLFTAGTPSLV